MLDKDMGNKITLLGCLGIVVVNGIYLLGTIIFRFNLNTILNWASILLMIAVAGGFGIMWIIDRAPLDLISAGTFGISGLYNILVTLEIFYISSNSIFGFIILLITNAYFIALAMRIFENNKIVALLLGCAFLFGVFSTIIVNLILSRATSNFAFSAVFFVWNLGYLVCSAICFLERKLEQ